jgi:DNA helicase MCM8
MVIAECIGKWVAMKGSIVRVSSVKPLITKLAFRCNSCDAETVLSLENGIYRLPSRCSTTTCRSRVFTPDRESSDTVAVDWQKIQYEPFYTTCTCDSSIEKIYIYIP